MAQRPRAANLRLRALMDEARMSNKGLARRVVDLAKARGVAHVRFDHTSVLQFLEKFTGVKEPNITDWRRATFGDLTAAFRFDEDKAAPPR